MLLVPTTLNFLFFILILDYSTGTLRSSLIPRIIQVLEHDDYL